MRDIGSVFTFVVCFVAILGAIHIGMYNQFIQLKQQIKAAVSNIDVALTKRYNALTNIVEVVKGYMKHEQEVYLRVTKVRRSSLAYLESSDRALEEDQQKIFAYAEAYPELKADTNFLHLQKVIADCEEHLQAARRLYNQSVKEYNIKIDGFPTNIIARQMGLTKENYYLANEEERENISINL